MATNGATPPPSNLSGIARPSKGLVVVKPKDMRGTLMRLWQLVRKKSRGMGLILVLSALSSVAAVISPLITGRAVTEISQGSAVTGALIALIAMYVFDWLMKFLEKYIMASVSPRIIDHLRRTLFDKIRELPLSFFDMHQHGELMSRLTNDVDNISTTISNSLTQLLMHCFTVIGVFIMMMLTSPLLTLIAFAGVGLITLLTKVVTKRTKKLFKERQRDLGILNGQIEESISGLSVVKAFCREEQAQADFDRKNEKLCAVSIKALVYSGCLMPITNVINNLCYLSVSVFSALMYLRGSITDIGMITSFLLYVRQFTRPFMEVANIYNSFQTAVAGAERMFEMLDEQSEPKDADDALPLEHVEGEIEFDNVCFAYGAGKQVLNGISLKIPAGTRVAIAGPTGSGKTTIISLLTRFYDVTSGRILLDGHDIRDYRLHDLRRAFGVVLQDTVLFAQSVKDNIAYGHADASTDDVRAAAEICGADAFIERLPNGYDTVLEQGGAELSQGERQLMTIARAVLTNAPILILDEATSSVDTVTEQKIRRAMLKLCSGRTSFIYALVLVYGAVRNSVACTNKRYCLCCGLCAYPRHKRFKHIPHRVLHAQSYRRHSAGLYLVHDIRWHTKPLRHQHSAGQHAWLLGLDNTYVLAADRLHDDNIHRWIAKRAGGADRGREDRRRKRLANAFPRHHTLRYALHNNMHVPFPYERLQAV